MDYSKTVVLSSKDDNEFIWQEENVQPFQRLMISWNALRPSSSNSFKVSISLKTQNWSDWYPLAIWKATSQKSFKFETTLFSILHDEIILHEDHKGTGWRIKIEGKDLYFFHYLHASTFIEKIDLTFEARSIYLKIDGLSQMQLEDPRNKRICSAVSSTAVLHFLNQNKVLCPLLFADSIYDEGFDLYGNWSFATAQTYLETNQTYLTKTSYANGFGTIYNYLKNGIPCTISVQGTIENAPLPYTHGHLLVIHGYDAADKRVFCMDPAYPNNKDTLVSYSLSSLQHAWGRRNNIFYALDRRHV